MHVRSGTASVALVALLALSVAGCGDSGTGPDDSRSPVGRWTLRSINGDPLPMNLLISGEMWTITAGFAEFRSNHIVMLGLTMGSLLPPAPTTPLAGTWSQSPAGGSELQISGGDWSMDYATFDENELTFLSGDDLFEYTR